MGTKSDIVKERKKEIRKEILRRLREQEPSKRAERSLKIQEKLLSDEEFRACETVMMYVSLPAEVDTHYLIEEALKRGKRVAVPCIEPREHTIIASELAAIEDLEKGPFGIYQVKREKIKAVPLEEIDLVVVPAVAYSRENMRLGRGKGYYDRFLAGKEISSSKTVGLAFHFQMVDSLPSDPHDRPVHRVITD